MTDAAVEITAPVKLPKKNGLVKVETAPVPVAPVSESAAIFGMIERLATQADVPVERIDKLFDLYQKVEADKARRAYSAAFAEMQPTLEPAARGGTGHNSTKYARWEDMADVIMPALRAHGFGISFKSVEVPGKVTVRCELLHRDGHMEFNEFPFPYDKTGSKNDIQAVKSAATYGMRVTAGLLLGIATGLDDDGKKAGAGSMITDPQCEEIMLLISETKADWDKFRARFKIETVSDLTAAGYQQAKGMLEQKKREAAK